MKYCLSNKVSKEYIQKADEIKIKYDGNEENILFKLLELKPDLSIILEIPDDITQLFNKDWDIFKRYNILCKQNFKIAFNNIEDITKASTYDIKSFLKLPVNSFEMLNYIIAAGACAARICGELVHNLSLLEKFENLEIRIYPNKSMVKYGIDPNVGSWIRPEDINNIPQIHCCEFDESQKEREQALYRIYAEEKSWSGRLSLLVEDIETHNVMNRMIPPEFQEYRNNCGWVCITKKRNCHYCENNLFLANPDLYKELNNERSNSER